MFFLQKEKYLIKKWNKKIENKLQELIMRAYPVTVNDINDEIWATNKNIKEYR